MGTPSAAASTPTLGAAPLWRRRRWRGPGVALWVWVALALHVGLLALLTRYPIAPPAQPPAISVRLAPAPETVPPAIEQRPIAPPRPLPEPAPSAADQPGPGPVPQPQLTPPITPPRSTPTPTGADLLNRLSRYRLDGQSQLELTLPDSGPELLPLGLADQSNMLQSLDRPTPLLPFEPGDMGVNFYPNGVQGDVARLFDRITPEFGFVTSFGLEVKCKYVLIVVSCGWGERL
ncbi:MAG: hypothetical protein AAGA23_08830 [Pseudomonadota bacterium]